MTLEAPKFLTYSESSLPTSQTMPTDNYRFIRIGESIFFSSIFDPNIKRHGALLEIISGNFDPLEDDADYLKLVWKLSPEDIERKVNKSADENAESGNNMTQEEIESYRQLLVKNFSRSFIRVDDEAATSLKYFRPGNKNRMRTLKLLQQLFPGTIIEEE